MSREEWITKATDVLEDAKDRFEVLQDASESTKADDAVLDRIYDLLNLLPEVLP